MVTLVNRVKVETATTGTGASYAWRCRGRLSRLLLLAGVADGDTVRYTIEDGSAWEIGSGVFDATAGTMTRVVSESSNSDAAINLSGSAEVFLTVLAEDINATIDYGLITGAVTLTDDFGGLA
jgi:hypothetical protein